MLNFDFLEKGPGILSRKLFLCDILLTDRKIFVQFLIGRS